MKAIKEIRERAERQDPDIMYCDVYLQFLQDIPRLCEALEFAYRFISIENQKVAKHKIASILEGK